MDMVHLVSPSSSLHGAFLMVSMSTLRQLSSFDRLIFAPAILETDPMVRPHALHPPAARNQLTPSPEVGQIQLLLSCL